MRIKNEIRNSFVQMVMHTYTAFGFEISRKSIICSSNFTKMPLGSVALLTWTMSLLVAICFAPSATQILLHFHRDVTF
jgi:hypothetical protein